MANDIDLDKFYTSATYQYSGTDTTFDKIALDKFYTLAAYQYSGVDTSFDKISFDKFYTLAAYQFTALSETTYDKISVDKLYTQVAYQRTTLPGDTTADTYYPYVTLLVGGTNVIGSTGTDASTAIIDESLLKNQIDIWGNVQIDTAQSKFGGSSVLFDGTGDWLQCPDRLEWRFSARDFTVECWARFNSTAGTQTIASQWATPSNRSWAFHYTASTLQFTTSSNGTASTTTITSSAWTPTIGQWYHLAADRKGGMIRIYVDGVVIGSGAITGALFAPSAQLKVGGIYSGGETNHFNGWMDEVRVTNGIARYAGSATVDDPYWANVVLLLRSNGTDAATTFTDESSFAHALTATGNAQIDTAQSKFGGSSALFDGTGDSITSPSSTDWNFGSGNFTVEMWVRFNSVSVAQSLISHYDSSTGAREWYFSMHGERTPKQVEFGVSTDGASGGGGGTTLWTPTTGVWYHVAFQRTGNNFASFVDGVMLSEFTRSLTAYTSTATLRIGNVYSVSETEYLNGWLDDVRITKGVARYAYDITSSDPYFRNVILLLHADGTDATTTFTDSSKHRHACTAVGNAQIDTAQSKFGGASMLLDGAGDRVTVPSPLPFQITNEAWTVEAWVRFAATETAANYLFSQWGTVSDRAWGIQYFNNGWHLAISVDGSASLGISNSWTQTGGVWYHFACTRDSVGDVRMFIDGTQIGTTQSRPETVYQSTQPLWIGAIQSSTPANDWNGWIDDLRITRGTARYTSNFTVPSAAYPDGTYTGFTPPTAEFPIASYDFTPPTTSFPRWIEAPTGYPVKVWNGSAWVEKPTKVWNGSAWITEVVKAWDGSAWT